MEIFQTGSCVLSACWGEGHLHLIRVGILFVAIIVPYQSNAKCHQSVLYVVWRSGVRCGYIRLEIRWRSGHHLVFWFQFLCTYFNSKRHPWIRRIYDFCFIFCENIEYRFLYMARKQLEINSKLSFPYISFTVFTKSNLFYTLILPFFFYSYSISRTRALCINSLLSYHSEC